MMPMTERSKPPSHSAKQRADAGRRQRRQNGQRMDVALIEHAEDHIDHHERGRDQDRLARQRGLEGLRIALEAGDDGVRHPHVVRGLLNGGDRFAERHAGAQVERQGRCRELRLMRHQERADGVGVEIDQRRQRHELPGRRRLDVDLVERIRVLLQQRQDFEYDEIRGHLREILRDVGLAEGVVERGVDFRRLNTKARGGVAVDRHREQRRVGLLIGRDIGELGQRLELGQHFRRPGAQFVESTDLAW